MPGTAIIGTIKRLGEVFYLEKEVQENSNT